MTLMLKTGFVLLILLSIFACHKKTAPVITERRAELPEKIASIYPPRPTVTPDTAAGKQIFTARCGRCHGLPEPQQFTRSKWDNILPLMFPRSGLNNEEALHVRTYIMSISEE